MKTNNNCLILGMVIVFLISSCAQQEVEIPSQVPEEIVEEAPAQQKESPPIEEASNLTNLTPKKQNLIVNQPTVQETKVQKSKCSREFSPQFNAGSYYQGALFDAHFHMPPAFEEEPETSPLFPKGFRVPILGKDVTLNEILCYFDKEKVSGAITFYLWEYENLEKSM